MRVKVDHLVVQYLVERHREKAFCDWNLEVLVNLQIFEFNVLDGYLRQWLINLCVIKYAIVEAKQRDSWFVSEEYRGSHRSVIHCHIWGNTVVKFWQDLFIFLRLFDWLFSLIFFLLLVFWNNFRVKKLLWLEADMISFDLTDLDHFKEEKGYRSAEEPMIEKLDGSH